MKFEEGVSPYCPMVLSFYSIPPKKRCTFSSPFCFSKKGKRDFLTATLQELVRSRNTTLLCFFVSLSIRKIEVIDSLSLVSSGPRECYMLLYFRVMSWGSFSCWFSLSGSSWWGGVLYWTAVAMRCFCLVALDLLISFRSVILTG